MHTESYYQLPQAKVLLDHLKSMNSGYSIEIILPKKRWPNLETRKSPEVMDIIRKHYEVSKDGFGNDLGFDALVHRNRDADLWIHILDGEGNLIGFSINEGYRVDGKTINYFRITVFIKEIQARGIYPLLNELKVAIIPADIYLVRTQNPVVFKYFNHLCRDHGLAVSPTAKKIDSYAVNIARNLIPDIDALSVQRSVLEGEALIGTPKPPKEHKPIWERMDIHKGDVVVIVGYPGAPS